jgi:hypothetical protein
MVAPDDVLRNPHLAADQANLPNCFAARRLGSSALVLAVLNLPSQPARLSAAVLAVRRWRAEPGALSLAVRR